MTVSLHPLDAAGIRRAQATVAAEHYLHTPVDSRCSVEGYAVQVLGVYGMRPDNAVGYLLLGRPQATACYPWYGSVDDVHRGRAACTRWQVLNLARVWLDPLVQAGGAGCDQAYLPGYVDRRGTWRSTLASTALGLLAARVGLDYLLRRPPCFLEEPYQLAYLLSYQHARRHRGTIYAAAGWDCYRPHPAGLQTWRVPLAPLTTLEDAAVRAAAGACARSRQYRSRRIAAATVRQLSLGV